MSSNISSYPASLADMRNYPQRVELSPALKLYGWDETDSTPQYALKRHNKRYAPKWDSVKQQYGSRKFSDILDMKEHGFETFAIVEYVSFIANKNPMRVVFIGYYWEFGLHAWNDSFCYEPEDKRPDLPIIWKPRDRKFGTKGRVYLLQPKTGGGDVYKIGCSINVPRRVKQLERKRDYKLACITSIASNDYMRLEGELHATYDKYCLSGEWFCLPDSEVRYLSLIWAVMYV